MHTSPRITADLTLNEAIRDLLSEDVGVEEPADQPMHIRDEIAHLSASTIGVPVRATNSGVFEATQSGKPLARYMDRSMRGAANVYKKS